MDSVRMVQAFRLSAIRYWRPIADCPHPPTKHPSLPARGERCERSTTPRRIVAASGHRAAAGGVGMIGAAVPFDMIEVEPPVAQVAHRAFRASPTEVGQIDVRHGQRFDIFRGFSRDAVPCEGEVAGR